MLISANKRMEASDVAVSTDGAVEMQLERVDDLNLEIRYAGPGLEIRSVQVTCPDPDWQEEFTGATHAFLADGGELGLRRGKNRAGGPARLACLSRCPAVRLAVRARPSGVQARARCPGSASCVRATAAAALSPATECRRPPVRCGHGRSA